MFQSVVRKINQTNIGFINTRRKSKYKSKPVRNNNFHRRDQSYSEKVRALREALIDIVQNNQSVIDEIIYGDLYDEFNKYFKSTELIESKEHLIYTGIRSEKHSTTKRMLEIKIEFESDSEDTTSTHTPLYSTSVKALSLRKPSIEPEYETDIDEGQNDYTDNYEESDEERTLSIEIPTAATRIESKQDSSSYSKSESYQQSSYDSREYSKRIKESFEINRKNPQKIRSNKMHTTPSIYFKGSRDKVDNRLGQVKENQRQREVLMKHDQLSKHASSVLDEGRSLATKNFMINWDTKDSHANYDKHKYKNNRPEGANSSRSKKRKGKSKSQKLKNGLFVIEF